MLRGCRTWGLMTWLRSRWGVRPYRGASAERAATRTAVQADRQGARPGTAAAVPVVLREGPGRSTSNRASAAIVVVLARAGTVSRIAARNCSCKTSGNHQFL